MKAKQTITASTAIAAVAVAFWNYRCRINRIRQFEFEGRCLREAIETLEGEGGLVLP